MLSLKDPLTWGFIFCNVCVLIVLKPAQLFPESGDVPLSRGAESLGGGWCWWPGLVVCMFFFWQAFVRDAFYSLKCLESVPFPLQSVSFYCSAARVFAWRPGGMGQLLQPCDSRLKAWSKGGVAVVLPGTITCFFKHTRTDMSAGSLLSRTGKQKEAPMDGAEY